MEHADVTGMRSGAETMDSSKGPRILNVIIHWTSVMVLGLHMCSTWPTPSPSSYAEMWEYVGTRLSLMGSKYK